MKNKQTRKKSKQDISFRIIGKKAKNRNLTLMQLFGTATGFYF